jgi:predicted RNase H-like nuclease
MAVLGVDGWKGRWVGALLTGRTVELLVLDDVAAVLAVPDVELIAIDMPIGLSDDGARACDLEARQRLSPFGAASSVFPAPVRPVLAAGSYEEARRISVAASGKSLSAQAWQLVASIRQVDDALGDPPESRVVEVHPELTFRGMDDRVRDRKATTPGQAQRLRALGPSMDVLDGLAAGAPGVPLVDALDACAAAWSAQRLADGCGECVGDGAVDSRGRPMRICW